MSKLARAFSLRGEIEIDDNAILPVPQLIFSYESPDRTRAWKIRNVYVWPREVDREIGTGDVQGLLLAAIMTDTATYTGGMNDITNVMDNRQCAWSNQQYNLRAGGTDFITRNGAGTPGGFGFIIDEDTVVTNQLYLNLAFRTESATSPSRKWNYLVTLDEMKISPWQSIFQQIKGIGQDISN